MSSACSRADKISTKGVPRPYASHPCAPETRAKISETLKRIKQPGSPLRKKASLVMKDKWQVPAYRSARLTIYRSPEFRAKMSRIVSAWRATKRHRAAA